MAKIFIGLLIIPTIVLAIVLIVSIYRYFKEGKVTSLGLIVVLLSILGIILLSMNGSWGRGSHHMWMGFRMRNTFATPLIAILSILGLVGLIVFITGRNKTPKYEEPKVEEKVVVTPQNIIKKDTDDTSLDDEIDKMNIHDL